MRPGGCAEQAPVTATVRAPLWSRALSLTQQWSRDWSRPPWDAALLLSFAAFATLYALITRNLAHRMWAGYVAVSYATGVAILPGRSVRRLLPLRTHRRWLVFTLLVAGTTVIPLAHQAVHGIANNVYLPLLAVFGLPAALFGPAPGTDPRICLLLVGLAGGRGRDDRGVHARWMAGELAIHRGGGTGVDDAHVSLTRRA